MADDSTAYTLGRQQRRLRAAGGTGRVTLRVELPAQIDRAVIDRRLATLAANHEALRTSVVVPAGLVDPVQLVYADATVSGAVLDVGGTPTLELAGDAIVVDLVTLQQVADVVCERAADAEDPIQFSEYAQWQAELAAEPAAGATEFWAGHEAFAWTAAPRPATSAPAPMRLAAAPGRWPGLLAATLALLTGDETIAFGVEVDARRSDELVGAAGPYTEVLPMVVDVQADDTLRTVAARCELRLAELEQFHEWAPDALPADAAVVLGWGPGDALVDRPATQAELRVAGDGSATVIDHAGTAAPSAGPGLHALAGTLAALLDLDPDTALGDIDVLDAVGLSAAEAESAAAPAVSVLGAVAGWAEQSPDRIAVRARGGATITYAELVDAISDIARRVSEQGSPGSPVAVVADRSVGAVVGLLAALWTGRGYLPLDPTQPAARLRAALDDCGCDLLLADSAADLGNFADLEPGGLVIERIGPSWKPGNAVPPELPAADALAYTIFTSGSTGAPKGVEVTIANLDAYVGGVRAALALAPGWNWALATLVSTDLGNTALFVALVGGGTLTVLDADEVLDATAFAAALAAGQVDAVKITPTHLSGLLGGEGSPVPRELVVLGGEALPWTLVDRLRDTSDVRIANHYGPTETTVGALTFDVTGDVAGAGAEAQDRTSAGVPIGRPLPGVHVAALTPRGARVPVGAAGELYIGGHGVARGYRGDPDRTAERFVTRAGRRLYRTGDIVRFRADGTVEFLGRRDGQVKIRGYRVETGEIEAALLSHPGVQRAAVVPISDESGTRLAAYLVSHYHPSPSAAELRTHLEQWLPAHMVPSWFIELERLPITANGKLDTRALPEPTDELERSDGYVAPESLVETEIATIFADLLGQERVGRLDDFFRLGGHSLLAAQVVMRIRQSLAVELSIQSIFLRPSVHALAGEIESLLLADIDEFANDETS